jgi:hypothetical protein
MQLVQDRVQWRAFVMAMMNPRILLPVYVSSSLKVKVKLSLCLTKHHAMKTY